jgi:dolichol kinase
MPNKLPGIRFGQRRWPGSHRSLLGSLAFVLSVSLFAAALVPVALLEVDGGARGYYRLT